MAKKPLKKSKPDVGYTVKMQQSTVTGKFRAQVVLTDGTVYVTGAVCSDEFSARISALAAAKKKRFANSELAQFLDKVESGKATQSDYERFCS